MTMKRLLLLASLFTVSCAVGEESANRTYVEPDSADSGGGGTSGGGTGGSTLDASGGDDVNHCESVTCNTPPPPICTDGEHRREYLVEGTCEADGTCSYPFVDAYCSFGCSAGACNGDPCTDMSCSNPPPNHCKDADTLVVFDNPGQCTSTGCSYGSVEVHCHHGCNDNACVGDPCAGIVCDSPPVNHCKDAMTARIYASQGTCAGGTCSYEVTEVPCPQGCTNGSCNNCQIDDHCPTGQWCQNNTCVPCLTNERCGASCTNCTALGQMCHEGQCVQCVNDGHCSSGYWCSNHACLPCNTNQRCGENCVACGLGSSCLDGQCSPCDTAQRCGPNCTPCSGATPHCRAEGTSAYCVACLDDFHCPHDQMCHTTTNVCGPPCSPTLTSVFSDDFSTPNHSAYTSGTDTPIPNSLWSVFTSSQHGVRIEGGRLQITNKRGSTSPGHGQGYAYVKTAGTGSAYLPAYEAVLKDHLGQEVVWTFNMRRDNPEGTNGGFSCTNSSSQNGITVGLAYVLATDSAAGLNASASTCSPSATSVGYAVALGGNNRLRLVRFAQGLRNGTITNIVESSTFTISNYFSVRVAYRAENDLWRLEVRNDGSSSFSVPTGGGAYGFSGTGTDATYVNIPLEYSGPYFQTGCTGFCSSKYTALFDNVNVGLRCAY